MNDLEMNRDKPSIRLGTSEGNNKSTDRLMHKVEKCFALKSG